MLNKKIVFSDYDGTIFISEEYMEQNINSINKYRSLGGIFVIVTGRSKLSVNKVIDQYKIQYDYIIANNGALIIDNKNKTLHKQEIDKEIVREIIQHLKPDNDIEILTYGENGEIDFNNNEIFKIRASFENYESAIKMEKQIIELFGSSVIAHAVCPSMYYKNFNYALLDIVSKKAGKETGIEKLLNELKINDEHAITIGDGRNDINMIEKYNGYSLTTAEDEAKNAASKIFDNVSDAIYDLII